MAALPPKSEAAKVTATAKKRGGVGFFTRWRTRDDTVVPVPVPAPAPAPAPDSAVESVPSFLLGSRWDIACYIDSGNYGAVYGIRKIERDVSHNGTRDITYHGLTYLPTPEEYVEYDEIADVMKLMVVPTEGASSEILEFIIQLNIDKLHNIER
jgi:hypothetical protein